MKKILALKWIAAILVMAACVALGYYSKGDKSREEVREEILYNPNDLEVEKLNGAVKQYTASYFNRAKWENDAIVEGAIYSQEVSEYKKNGYLIQSTAMKSENQAGTYVMLPGSVEKVVSRDSKQRLTELSHAYYSYRDGADPYIWYTKRAVTYDDAARTAAMIEQVSDDNIEYRDDDKRVWELNRYGRIDYDNYEHYSIRYELGTEPSSKKVTKRDEKDNAVLTYEMEFDGSDTYVSRYRKTEYVYY